MFKPRDMSAAVYYLFSFGEAEQQRRFFKELRFIAIAILVFGVLSWLATVALMRHREMLDQAQAVLALAGMLAGLGLTVMSRSLRTIVVHGAASVMFITFGFRVMMLATDDPAFWVLPLGVMITLTIAPIFSGIAYYLGISLCVWLTLGLGQFPDHAEQTDQHWPVLAVVVSVLIGLALNIYFLVLRIHNYRARRDLTVMAYTDGLTGLNNRRMFTQRARALQARGKGTAFFLMIDIDDFKKINDADGHEVGDEVLKKTAAVIAQLSAGHLCGRLGGEEFAVIYQGEQHAACAFAAKLLCSMEAAFRQERVLSISIGMAELIKEADLSHTYRRADESLYLAKKNGKNRYVLYAS